MATSRLFGRYTGLLEAVTASSASFTTAASNGSAKGIMQVIPVSPQLSKFIGASESSRTEVTKKIWAYIKLHNLQNPANKKEIICDETLKTIFAGKDTVGMLEIAKLISPHFVKSK